MDLILVSGILCFSVDVLRYQFSPFLNIFRGAVSPFTSLGMAVRCCRVPDSLLVFAPLTHAMSLYSRVHPAKLNLVA